MNFLVCQGKAYLIEIVTIGCTIDGLLRWVFNCQSDEVFLKFNGAKEYFRQLEWHFEACVVDKIYELLTPYFHEIPKTNSDILRFIIRLLLFNIIWRKMRLVWVSLTNSCILGIVFFLFFVKTCGEQHLKIRLM